MISAVLFDLDGTLLDRDGASARWFEALLQSRPGLAGERSRPEALRLYLALDAHGSTDRARFCSEVVAAFPGIADSPASFWQAFSAGVASSAHAESGAVELLAELRRRVPIAILTNGSSRNQRAKLSASGLGDLKAFVSEEIGFEKPDPRAFETACAGLGAAPAEALFVGDDPERDIAGARAVGMRTCWLARGRRWNPADFRPDLQVDSVGELSASGLLR